MESLLETAKARLNEGHADHAVAALKEALARDPSSFDAQYLLGVAYGKAGDFRNAAEALKFAATLKPDHAGSQFNLGVAYQRLGDSAAALSAYQKALRLDPEYHQAREAMASLQPSPPAAANPRPHFVPSEAPLCLCPDCRAPIYRSQRGMYCPGCRKDLTPVFEGRLAAKTDLSGGQVFCCTNCGRGVTHFDRPCPGCGLDPMTGEVRHQSPLTPPIQPASTPQHSLEWGADAIAPVWKRVIAANIDRFVLNFLITVATIPVLMFGGRNSPSFLLMYFGIPILYETMTVGQWGNSLGKWRYDILVDRIDGTDITWTGALLRSTVKWGLYLGQDFLLVGLLPEQSFFVMFCPSVSDLWALTNKERRALHDILAGTIVTQG